MKTDLVILDCDGVLIDSKVISARRQVAPPGMALDTALILGGLSLQLVLAFVRDRLALKTW
jgi:phosphoglycolate phosphatase-like HAD superfamily hydrolase